MKAISKREPGLELELANLVLKQCLGAAVYGIASHWTNH